MRIFLISASIWFNFQVAKSSQELAYSAGYRVAEIDNKIIDPSMVKVHPKEDLKLSEIRILIMTGLTQFFILILMFDLLKCTNKEKNNNKIWMS